MARTFTIIAVAVWTATAATACTAPAVCTAARATAAAIESGADATADAFCGSEYPASDREPAEGNTDDGTGNEPLDPASTAGPTISESSAAGSN